MKTAELERSFTEAYEKLNKSQKQAVDTIEGPVMVIAGPGTGKTQILTLRIANILLQTDARPENILALTFTDSGVKAMRERLRTFIGEDAYDVGIYTFHSFADSLIQRYPEAYPNIIGGRAASDIERVRIIESILSDNSLKALRPSGDVLYYVRPIRDAVDKLKQEYITPDAFAASLVHQEAALNEIQRYHEKGAHKGKERGEYKDALKHLERNRELLTAYRQYESALRAERLYDYNDMIVETVAALKNNEDMLRDIQETFRYVLADEHQDVNGSQNKILEFLVSFHEQPNLFVVGDEKQAIYRFQGASLDNFLYFEETFGQTTTISLTDNYRSGQVILDAAHDLIKTEDPALTALRIPLRASAVTESTMEVCDFAHQVVEDSYIVEMIAKDVKAGVSPHEIAIILRTNREVEDFAIALRKRGIAAAPSADSDVLEHPITHSMCRLLEAVARPTDEAVLFRLIHEPYWGIALEDLVVVLRSTGRDLPLTTILRDEAALKNLKISNVESVHMVAALIDEVILESQVKPPHRLLETLLDKSGFLKHVLKHDPYDGARIVRRIFDEIESMVRRGDVKTLSEIVEQLLLHRQYGIALNAPYIPFTEEAVHVMTAHKSKGLEFEHVYIPHVTDKIWGAKKGRQLFTLPITKHEVVDGEEDDERRLLYVAMTRAKKKLVCTHSEQNTDGREQILSRFISGIDESKYHEVDVSNFVEVFSPVNDLASVEAVAVNTELVLTALTERGLSPTALNNYLKSPWEYLYRNVLRAPQIKSAELQFGSAVHGVLDTIVRHYKDLPEKEILGKIPELLKQQLNKEAVTNDEYIRLHERGLSALTQYVPTMHVFSGSVEARTEMQVEGSIETGIPEYPVLKLNGNLDRVDIDTDGSIIRVIDYKTGKPKTRNYIEGKTASSTGDYKRQLVFYALLLSLQADKNKHCRTGVLSFVESDSNGVVKEELFEITDDEINELKSELVRVTHEIVSGEMFKVVCDPEVCHYCELAAAWHTK